VIDIKYEGTVYRPPSEARSWILQATIGCSHNKCSFCSMYKDKSFKIRDVSEILSEIESTAKIYPSINRVFIADGDALIVKTEDLLKIISKIKSSFSLCKRIGIYTSPKSVHLKSIDELILLKNAGLEIGYLGLESGSNNVLEYVNKGDTKEGIIAAGKKLKKAGIKVSVTVISGLGGQEYFEEHALETAKAINEINPDYLGLLTLMIEPGTKLYEDVEKGIFKLLSPFEIGKETLLILKNLDSPGTVFRSNHASNYIALKGDLNEDKELLIRQLERAIKDENYKDESYRKL